MSRTISLPSFSIPENASHDPLVALGIDESKEKFLARVKAAIAKNSHNTRDVVVIAERCLRDGSLNTNELVALALLKGFETYYNTGISASAPSAPSSAAPAYRDEDEDDDVKIVKSQPVTQAQISNLADKIDDLADRVDTVEAKIDKIKGKVKKINNSLKDSD